jgi:hypothetical protein
MKGYGVFIDNKLVFGDNTSYAIYERTGAAEAFKSEMCGRWFNTKYKVKEIIMEV